MIETVPESQNYNLVAIANKIMKKKFLFLSLTSFSL